MFETPTSHDAVENAIWASEGFDSPDEWARLRLAVVNTQWVGDRVLEDVPNSISWMMDTLRARAELREVGNFSQFRLSVTIFHNFESDEDGLFFANLLNQMAVGGSYIFDPDSGSVSFVCYCVTAVWWDLAIVLHLFRIACGQAEVMARRSDLLLCGKCKVASVVDFEQLGGEHPVVLRRMWDMYQPDFVSGLWIAQRERDYLITELSEFVEDFDIQFDSVGSDDIRAIESMNFFFRISPPEGCGETVNDFNSPAYVAANEWCAYGRAISTISSVPYFTVVDEVPEEMSDLQAVEWANIFNRAATEMMWEKLGVGSWQATGSQMCFSRVVPHAVLKPIIAGINRFEVGDFLLDIVAPHMTARPVQQAIRELHYVGLVTARDPLPGDSLQRLRNVRKAEGLVRIDDATASSGDTSGELWQYPSEVVLVYGIFDPVGSTMGSIEIVTTFSGMEVVNRWRHPLLPGEVSLGTSGDPSEIGKLVLEAVASLSERASCPIFVYVPAEFSPDFRESINDALLEMASGYERSGLDVGARARRIWAYPNPWGRVEETPVEELPPAPEIDEMNGCDALVAVITHPQLVDFNIGLFQAWWEGAIMFSNHPDEPNEATRVVEDFMGHTYDRLRGPERA
jgi:hypothetical protein